MSGIIVWMIPGAVMQNNQKYKVVTQVFEGPLDLLLQLIERAELDITNLALAEVTDQYLEHLRRMQEMAAEDVSAFIVIASKLLQIKSEALLPRPPIREAGEEDPAEALARQLIAYKRYREIANVLEEREASGLHTYLRLAAPPKIESKLDLSDITLEDLVLAAASAFSRTIPEDSLISTKKPLRITIKQKIRRITDVLKMQKRTSFNALLDDTHSRLEIVVTFLAILELIKRRFILASQEALFSDINLVSTDEMDENQEFDLEFRE